MLRLLIIYICFSISLAAQDIQTVHNFNYELKADESWWGGIVVDGPKMPFGKFKYSFDLFGDLKGNQGAPVLISNLGEYIWCDKPFAFEFNDDTLKVQSLLAEIESGKAGNSLRDAYIFVCRKYFPPKGKVPDSLLFTRPQYNTWIELTYNQNEDDILKYAQGIIKNGFPAGVIMIDDNWQEDYGDWQFKASKFKTPEKLIKRLHKMGFKIMLWVCPFVSPDSPNYRFLEKENAFLMEDNGTQNPAMIRWWNGVSSLLDLTNPSAKKWFTDQLDILVEKYKIDGFKFDAGDPEFYTKIISKANVTPNEQTELYAKIGLKYSLNEYRACWEMGCQPLVQRLRDKRHNWEDLKTLIPGIISQGLMGYQFSCPDMIGGGEVGSFLNLKEVDQDLMVRWTECSALMPMMQFSVAPWRVLNETNLKICQEMSLLHKTMGGEILQIAKKCAFSGEPIIRNLEYAFPHKGYDQVKDEFMLGEDILVAPVINDNTSSREIIFPAGRWKGDDGSIVEGPCKIGVIVPINRLPWYRKIDL